MQTSFIQLAARPEWLELTPTGSGWTLALECAKGPVKSDAFEGLSGLLHAFACLSLCLAADDGKAAKPPTPMGEEAQPFDHLSLTKGNVAGYWLSMSIAGMRTESYITDFNGLRIALQDACAFFAYRQGRMSYAAASQMSTRALARNPGEAVH